MIGFFGPGDRNGPSSVASWRNVRAPREGEKSEKNVVFLIYVKKELILSLPELQNGDKMELCWISFLIKNSFVFRKEIHGFRFYVWDEFQIWNSRSSF